MKKVLYCLLATLSVISCKRVPESDEATVTQAKEAARMSGESYHVDVAASKIEWIGTKVTGYHTGTVQLKSGELKVSDNEITAGNFVIDMTSIRAIGPESVPADASAKLTGHLSSADFFDVKNFPEASFVITSVKPFTGKADVSDEPNQEKLNPYKVTNPTHTISGNLTVKGIEKNIEFPASVVVNNNTVEARAKFNINRKLWNIVYAGKPDDLIRDEVHLGILLVAKK
jgi:polyisoprenoid-binding protein YceI